MKRSEFRELRTIDDQFDKSPSDVPNDKWQYDNGDWKDGDGDIIVQCVNNKGKIILLTLEITANIALYFLCFLRLHSHSTLLPKASIRTANSPANRLTSENGIF